MDDKFKKHLIIEQSLAQIIEMINKNHPVVKIINPDAQDAAFNLAQQQINKVYDFVSKPEHILGSAKTKHGEIAEQVEVGVRNAKQALHQQPMTADIDSIGRTSPTDYKIDGIPVQSKFINGEYNTLQHVQNHHDKYPSFSQDGYYHIAKDQHETITKIIAGEHVENLSSATQQAIKNKVATIELETGHEFSEIVQPGISSYAEVQLGNIDNTLDKHNADLAFENQQLKNGIHQDHSPSLAEGIFATEAAAVVGAGISLARFIWQKRKAGKYIFKGDYTAKDWQELGINVGKDALLGGITGTAIYAITNYASLSAPFAAAIVSASKAIATLLQQYHAGKINSHEFYKLAMISCSESAMVGLCTVVGQMLIPIPVLGSILGAISGQILLNFTKGSGKVFYKNIQEDIASFASKLNNKQKQIFAEIDAKFKALGDLTTAAFDITNNANLVAASVELANYYNVKKSKRIKNIAELDNLMLS